jgi:LPS sulfotransferase NodH
MTPLRGYLVCCIERTGSNVLGHALATTGMAGRPVEYFNPVEQEKPWMREILSDSTLLDGLPKILAAGTTPNGLFGAKVHWAHFQYLGLIVSGRWNGTKRGTLYDLLRSRISNLCSQAAALELLRSRFSNVTALSSAYTLLQSRIPDLRMIWLRRQNMVARAISHFRARQTGIWHQSLSQNREVLPKQTHDFDFAEIRCLHYLGIFQEECWQKFFQQHEILPHCVVYEELVADHEATVRRALKFLDIDGKQVPISRPVSLKQSDALSEEWEKRYRKLIAEGGLS